MPQMRRIFSDTERWYCKSEHHKLYDVTAEQVSIVIALTQ